MKINSKRMVYENQKMIGEGEKYIAPRPLFLAIDMLKRDTTRFGTEFYEIPINDAIETSILKESLQLPFEIYLFEHEGAYIVSTNGTGDEQWRARLEQNWLQDKGHQSRYIKFLEKIKTTKLFLHTHPNIDKLQFHISSSSFFDVQFFNNNINDSCIILIADDQEILETRKPIINPTTGKIINPSTYDPRELIHEFCASKNLAFSQPIYEAMRGKFTMINSLPLKEQGMIQREFMIKSGMVVSETPWNDGAGIKNMMMQINAQRH